jgi:hypothetical protein
MRRIVSPPLGPCTRARSAHALGESEAAPMATFPRLVVAFHGFVMGCTHVLGATSIRAHAACTARSINARKSQHPYDCRTGSALIVRTIEASHDAWARIAYARQRRSVG